MLPSAAWHDLKMMSMWATATLTDTPSSLEPDLPAEFGPVGRVKRFQFRSDRHSVFVNIFLVRVGQFLFSSLPCPALPTCCRGRSVPVLPAQALSDRSVACIIQELCLGAGLAANFSGHSLGRGAIAAGVCDGTELVALKCFSRHQTFGVVKN